ncbi:histone H1-like repetitive region-containing protein [Pelagicoccus mobilis]|uniref:Histone H1-like repetitive region-containing protein n=1 Tax=Pelagicoccus mobilis TaxID=415221 RepID=A0A934RYB9_9BACT|nr:histone H1-like repetitive region-containing protein [Pelagicoccus mobilis]MBK1878593.1 histone H1-like repetitive region-containing protein [Pelagicoccus mobilis]
MKKTTIAAAKKAAKKAVKKAAVKKVAAKKAPAKKVAKKAPVKKVAAKKAPAKKAVAKKAAPKKAVAKKAAPKKAAAKKTAKKATPKTTIAASVDVGFGNTLYLRGAAPGLSWSEGVPMDCKADSSWSIDIAGVTTAFEFKVLINDEYWSAGYNEVAEPGKKTSVTPVF